MRFIAANRRVASLGSFTDALLDTVRVSDASDRAVPVRDANEEDADAVR
jgi:hypothetical protein